MNERIQADGGDTKKAGGPVSAPSINLPKGGGAIRGIGEKFAANPVTGTGSMTVPIATSPGRSGFGPQLSLSYDSSAGNGPFGLGWNLSLPSITRKTDKGLPKYVDAEESDVFILSGAEDLVPVYRQDLDGSWVAAHPGLQRDPVGLWVRDQKGQLLVHEDDRNGYRVRRYRPRIEGLFARIERWTKLATGEIHWRSISKDNITTLYGKDNESRIFDPAELDKVDPSDLGKAHPTRIFSWLICQSYDDKGNAIVYEYKPEDSQRIFEDSQGQPLPLTHERNRTDAIRSTNRYLKRIKYGNRTPNREATTWNALEPTQLPGDSWMFEVLFDFGEHDADTPTTNESRIWPVRNDPFSSYRPGFEVRTYRLCQRVLMFHHFADVKDASGHIIKEGYEGLVRSTDFEYSYEENPQDARNPIYSFLCSVTQSGYKLQTSGGYSKKSLPPVDFTYSEARIQEQIQEVDFGSLENLPYGLDASKYQWVDLDGEGISGILTEQGGGWFYKRNLSPLPIRKNGSEETNARFAPIELVSSKPALSLTADHAQFMDLAGDGQPDVVAFAAPVRGFYERTDDAGWKSFRPFRTFPNLDTSDPNVRLVDLNGDGHSDILVSEDEVFRWHPSLAEEGFGGPMCVRKPFDEEKGPALVFADGTESIYLADMSGDGLTDLVRVRNGEICYWPNLGYGRFGTKVTMDNSPRMDTPDLFDQSRVRLADIDGSGTTDIIYLHGNGPRIYFNQSGNSWSKAQTLAAFPPIDNVASVHALDLLGNSTACLVWSSPLPGDSGRQMRYVDLMGQKPHLLIKTVNNLGAETVVSYAPSTKFYLRDEQDGNNWITKLPFPVHVVERVETFDRISRNRFVARYAYHHGYFDGTEREFRGFGMVEQWDTEQLAALVEGDVPADNVAAASHVPPLHTKTWFHTGVYIRRERVSRQFEHEYFREPGLTIETARPFLLDDTIIPSNLTLEEEREACRALKGSILRQEVYADDVGSSASPEQLQRAQTPYTVTEQNFSILPLQPRNTNRHAVFFTHAREAINYYYERNPADPRIQHTLTLEVDNYGNILKQAAIGYGRRTQIRLVDAGGNVQVAPNPGIASLSAADQAKQTTPLLTYTENRVTNAVELPDAVRNPLPCEALTFELTGYTATGGVGRFQASDLVEPDPVIPGRLRHRFIAPEVVYEDTATGNQRRRPIERLRTLYRRDDLSGILSLSVLQSLALPGESYKLAFTPGLLTQVFQRPHQGQPTEPLLPNPSVVLGGQGGDRGGYLQSQTLKADGRFPTNDADDCWWIPSGQSFYSTNPADSVATELTQARRHFFLTRRYHDPFGNDAFVDFDANDLLMVETRDALGNRVTVEASDYRVLQPRLVSDPNGNQTEVAFDTMGMVVGTAVMGKPSPAPVEGDTLTGFVTDLAQIQFDGFFNAADPHVPGGALLKDATTRIIYDLDRFRRSQKAHPNDPTQWQPAYAATLVRETHFNAPLPPQGLKIQVSFSYSDGFGREIQKKIQAEQGPLNVDDPQAPIVNPRWVSSGWTIFNNKGKPVRQYEPYFSLTHDFEFGVTVGVSPILFYDAAERVIATLHPNHTYEKVVFDPWRQTTYDVNDTCVARNEQTGDPRTDPDIAGYVAEYFKTQPATWQTWYAQRIGSALGQDERNAALRAAAHADTPTTAHFDTLGRPFLTVARNRVVCTGHDLDATEDSFGTRVELDIEGNQREVRDERKLPVNHLPTGAVEQRIVMRYAYNMLGNRLHQLSMEAGARWMLNDVADKPIRAWDSRGHNFRTSYDALRRPIEQTVRGTTVDSDARTLNRDILVDKIDYGEPPLNATPAQETEAQRLNLRTRVYRHFDAVGVATNARLDTNGNPTEAYDFKGNLLRSTRRLVSDYTSIPDWLLNPQLDDESFEGGTRYDALNRPIQSIAPHSSLAPATRNVIQPIFNEANLLERLDLWLERAAEPANLLDPNTEAAAPVGIANLDYDAKGQRLRIDYKNGASTVYRYDPLTFRLTQVLTRRSAATFPGDDPQPPIAGWPGRNLQNLHYTYDPAGNITHIQDDAQQTIYFKNKRVEPSNDYIYDALYRLVQASGREHLGQTGAASIPHSYNDAGRVGLLSADATGRFAPNDGNAMGAYIERYVYDAVGNFLQMQHRRSDPANPGWTRAYDYVDTSLIENGSGGTLLKTSNRLTHTTLSPNGASPQIEPYQHDAHGNMTRMPHLGGGMAGPNMHWDYKDQLRQTDLGGGGATFYVYDTSGQRMRKVWEKAPGLTEERIYLGGFEIFRKHNGPIGANAATFERETLHVMADKQRIALVERRTLDAEGNDQAPPQLIRYQLGNHLGSASLELDERAQIISYEEYAPYGSSTYQAVRSQTETPKRYRFTGKERDEETGFSYHGARYYAPWLAKWLSCDPAGMLDGTALYAFARNNSITLVDESGRQGGFGWQEYGKARQMEQELGELPAKVGQNALDAWMAFRRKSTRAVLWVTGAGATPEEAEKNYQVGKDPKYGEVPPTITQALVDATPEIAGMIWLSWASALTSPRAQPPGSIPARGSSGEAVRPAPRSWKDFLPEARKRVADAKLKYGDNPDIVASGKEAPPGGGTSPQSPPSQKGGGEPGTAAAALSPVEQVLSDMGVSAEARAAFVRGEAIVFDISTDAGDTMMIALRLQGQRVSAGIVSYFPEGGPSPANLRAFSGFRGDALRIARAANATELELHGIAVLDRTPQLKEMLVRQGFQRTTMDVPKDLGGGTVESYSKVFPVRPQ